MKNRLKNPIKILALAGLILAVIASGTAFATNCFSGTDTSAMQWAGPYPGGYSYLQWITSASGNPQVGSGTTVQWANSITNNDPSTGYQPQIQYYDSAHSQTNTVTYPNTIYAGSSWTTSNNPPAYGGVSQTSSGTYRTIYHNYISGGTYGISNTNNQHSWRIA